jgi:hypothetical protein
MTAMGKLGLTLSSVHKKVAGNDFMTDKAGANQMTARSLSDQ